MPREWLSISADSSELMRPVRRLKNKTETLILSEEQQPAFGHIERPIVETSVLMYFDPSLWLICTVLS